MPHLVNLDALIKREDFEVTTDQPLPSSLSDSWKATDLVPGSLQYQILRKPDFQRETANWTPEKVMELVQSFLEGDLIPAVILWRAPSSGNIFVIDGAHRLSALIAWVHDDYGDKRTSREFYENLIPQEQTDAAEKTRKLIVNNVGSYEQLVFAGQHPDRSQRPHVLRAKNLGVLGLRLQWVLGDAAKAEASFFRINQKATAIDPTELIVIKSRNKPNAVAARALLRAGVGHKYWSAFPDDRQREIEELARAVYDILFIPPLETPIKTLDLPVAGRGYSADSMKLVFDFVNFANGLITEKKLEELQPDQDGTQTLAYLKKVRALSSKISGNHPGSLGLHPAVYFYGATGRYQPPAFLATVCFIQELERTNAFFAFTGCRARFEEFLLKYRYFTNQIIQKYGSGTRPIDPLLLLYQGIFRGIADGKDDDGIMASLQTDRKLKFLKQMTEEDKAYRKNFSRETKSIVFIREALHSALRCKLCKARIHVNSISLDHIKRKAEGGLGDPDNAQLTHPYCNSGFKEKQVADANQAAPKVS